MDKLITRRNLLIANIFLGIILSVVGLNIVLAVVGGDESYKDNSLDVDTATTERFKAERLEQIAYNVITDNDLFIFKGKVERVEVQKNYYNLTKVWTLQATLDYPDGLHALIMDKGKPDREARKPHTIHEVKVGDIIKGETKPRIYEAKILDIQKGYVQYYRLDMEDVTEEERTFVIKAW